jgi:hypothetical protein
VGLGIDPDQGCIDEVIAKGFSGIRGVFNHDLAKQLVESGYHPDIVSAQNVLAHVDDLDSFLSGVALLSPADFVLEVPWAYHTILEGQWDQIYHEHLSYFLAGPLDRILARHGLWPIRAMEVPTHGGSLRIYCSTLKAGNGLDPFIAKEKEAGLYNLNTYVKFAQDAFQDAGALRTFVKALDQDIAAVGAAAKGCVRLNLARLSHLKVRCIVDDTPSKQGKYQPGTGIPIISRNNYVTEGMEQYLMILPWNYNDEIRRRYANIAKKFILVNPPRVVSAES